MCDRQRFTIRTSDEIINRIEALAGISGESKNSVANVLLAIQLGGVTCGATSKKTKGGSNSEEPQESSVVHDDGDNNSSEKSGAKRNKRVSPPTPPSSQKKKNIPKGISQKEKVSRVGRRPKDIDEVIEYFVKRSIPDPVKPKAEKFFAFYETNGWVQGKNKPIRNWHSCLTTWLLDDRCPDDWKPKKQATTNVKLKDVLQWMQDEHPEWYEKFKDAKNINEIDGYYIDEFRGA